MTNSCDYDSDSCNYYSDFACYDVKNEQQSVRFELYNLQPR